MNSERDTNLRGGGAIASSLILSAVPFDSGFCCTTTRKSEALSFSMVAKCDESNGRKRSMCETRTRD